MVWRCCAQISECVSAEEPCLRAIDVVGFALRCVENEISGVWNVNGQLIEFSYILDRLIEVSGSDVEINMRMLGVVPWTDLLSKRINEASKHRMER